MRLKVSLLMKGKKIVHNGTQNEHISIKTTCSNLNLSESQSSEPVSRVLRRLGSLI